MVDRELASRRLLTAHLARIGAEAWPFAGGREFIDILDHLMPALILLDMDLVAPGGLEVLAELRHRRPAWPVVATSAAPEVAAAVEAMKLGALDFLEKPIDAAALAAALIPAWGKLEKSLEQNETRRLAEERLGRLTPRELDIALVLFAGHSNKAAAHQLGISVRTVEMHRAHIMAKLGVKTLAEAAVLATQASLARSAPAAPAPPAKLAAPPVFLPRRLAARSG
ncbi:MAG: response regulator [Alphaproteobacteria bacterium]|nr:response regulator [Alphaproteobacteria bacterium]MBV9373407.1 response regulator [Alphaproteobacteria bacterium]